MHLLFAGCLLSPPPSSPWCLRDVVERKSAVTDHRRWRCYPSPYDFLLLSLEPATTWEVGSAGGCANLTVSGQWFWWHGEWWWCMLVYGVPKGFRNKDLWIHNKYPKGLRIFWIFLPAIIEESISILNLFLPAIIEESISILNFFPP